MKATLEFDLPDDSDELDWARGGRELSNALTDFLMELRNDYKYGDDEVRVALAEEYRDKLYAALTNRGVEHLLT